MNIEDYRLPNYSAQTRFVHNAMLLGKHREKKFLQRLYDKGILHLYDKYEPEQEYINQFFQFLDLFEAKYKDNFDLGLYYDGCDFYPYFKVLYPEFVITNSNGESHIIRDLVIIHQVAYKEGHVYTKHPYGGRLSKTLLEIAGSYQQSHLGSRSSWNVNPFNDYSTFCVGGDTDVSRMIAEFQVEIDWDRYELYLFCIDSMITWESLEGVPYIKMATIKNALNNRVTSANRNYVTRVISYIEKEKLPLDVNFYIADNRFKIKPDERANAFIKDIVLKVCNFSEYKSILVTRVPNTFDQFLQMKAEGANVSSFEIKATDQYMIFRGDKRYARMIKEDQRQEKPLSIDDYNVYPNFLKDVLKQLECRIYEKAVTKSGTKIQNSRSNANRSVTSDTVSM
jgi:hypothetical protein